MVIRMARSDDAALIAYHRTQMFREMGVLPDHLVGALQTATREQLGSLVLHASPQGKPLYEQLGFEPGNEMRYAGDQTPDSAERARS